MGRYGLVIPKREEKKKAKDGVSRSAAVKSVFRDDSDDDDEEVCVSVCLCACICSALNGVRECICVANRERRREEEREEENVLFSFVHLRRPPAHGRSPL